MFSKSSANTSSTHVFNSNDYNTSAPTGSDLLTLNNNWIAVNMYPSPDIKRTSNQ